MTLESSAAGATQMPGRAEPFAPFLRDPPHSWEWRGERLRWTRRHIAILASPEISGNEQVLIGLARIPARQAAPWHRHEGHEEFVFVLEGRGEFWAERMGRAEVGPGSLNLIPPGSWHMHRSRADSDLVFLWGYTPPGQNLVR